MKRYSPIILILVAIGLFFLFVDPQYKSIKVLQNQKADNDSLLGLSQDLQNKRDRLHSSFNSISASEKETLQKLLPNTVDNVRLILDINNIAENYGIIIRNIVVKGGEEEQTTKDSRTKPTLSSEIGTITLSFSMISTYDVFLEFLQDLEESLRIVDVERLTVERVDGQFMNFGVTLSTYWLR